MAHLALYRTYRPKDFESVVGQKHIIQTLKNQVKNDLLAHAYMFTGPRGTGKTSIARIVAKAINCTNPKNANPCSACESCLAIANGSHPDVFELDGASNNGVDEIRDIRERVKYSPTLSPYKVYIIDEVHMLSTGAFNALLKTLEEPPPHVIFMLATTEIHKVPDTILSRTQRFDLLQIPAVAMTEHLERILCELEIKVEDGVAQLVATLASGGLRDALSILDQAIAYKKDVLTLTDIHELNGSVEKDELEKIIKHILAKDFAEIIGSVRLLVASGKLPGRITDGLLGVLKDELVAQKINISAARFASEMAPDQILTFIKKLNRLTHELKIATDCELMLEVGLVELGLGEVNQMVSSVSEALEINKEIEFLTEQIRNLQAEVQNLQKKGSSFPQARSMPQPHAVLQPHDTDFPVFVQGELVSGPYFDATDVPINEPHNFAAGEDMFTENEFQGQGVEDELLIENILALATKKDKSELQQKIASLNAFAKLSMKEVTMLLKDADIVAATPKACILVYDYETTTQKLLTGENHAQVTEILSEKMGCEYTFLALPKDFWLAQRENYVAQKKQGNVPVLAQYPQHEEQKMNLKMDEEIAEIPFYQGIVDLFGDVVEVVE